MPTNAEIAARRDLDLYKRAVQKFRRMLDPMLNDIPKTLAYAHILRVNTTLEATPAPTWDQRKGFLRVTHAATTATGISWDSVEDLDKNSYVWAWDLNSAGLPFQRANISFFSEPTEDFWKCLYARHVLGPQVFDFLWKRRDTTFPSQFDALVYTVTLWGKHIAGWSYVRLKTTLTIELPYVFAVAKINGILSSKGFGIRPVMDSGRTLQTLI
jgi:hypothetical protein